jgi:endonuclease III
MVAAKSTKTASPLAEVRDRLETLHGKAADKSLSSVEEMVVGVFEDEDIERPDAIEAVGRLCGAYSDWNELRVARTAELGRRIDPLPNAETIAQRLRDLLNRIFERTGTISLSFLRDQKIVDARRQINDLEPVGRAVADRVLMLEIESSMLPFSPEAVKLAKQVKLIPKSGNRQGLNKLIADTFEREEGIRFFHLLEIHAASGGSAKALHGK